MTRHALTIGAVTTALAIGVGQAWAAPQQGSRPNTGSTVGSAAPRGGDTGSGSSGSSSSSSGSSSAPSSDGSSMGAGSTGASPWGGERVMRREAPERPSWSDGGRRSGSGGPGSVAVPRGGGSPSEFGTIGSTATGGWDRAGGPNREPVPAYSRPRGNRPVVGTAGERQPPDFGGVYPPGNGGRPGSGWGYYPVYYDPFFYSAGYYGYYGYNSFYAMCGFGYAYSPFCSPWGYSPWLMPGYGFGFGYFGYDNWYDPFGYGVGYGELYGLQGGGGGGGGYTSSESAETGSLRLKVKPGSAQVFVDGFYVGTIDSFDGAFQKLTVAAGPHKIELRADGYEPEQFEVLVQPGQTVAYKGEMKRVTVK